MFKTLTLFLLGIFFFYITVCSCKYIIYGKVSKILLRFMTSCMILFTFTIVIYNDILSGGSYNRALLEKESNVFLNSEDNGHYDDYKYVNDHSFKITAFFDNPNPTRGSITNLIVSGPKGGKATAIVQYKGHGTPYIMDIGAGGQAVIPIRVEESAEPGFLVVVDVIVDYQGKQYKTYTVFTPR